MVATRYTSLPQNIPKCFCDCGLPLDPTGEAHGAPQTSQLDLGASSWWRKEGEDKKREGREGKGSSGR